MNLSKFIEIFTDDALLKSTGSRRAGLGQFGKVGKGLAFASLPLGLGLTSQKSSAASMAPAETPTEALQLALTLEYLEADFYTMGLDSGIIPAGKDLAVFQQISKHETAHVNFLAGALGTDAPERPTFDFTAGGTFPDVFTNYATFLAVAQAFEDTGVRAYKGQAPNLISAPTLLTYALQIHSVEARHASEVRRLRGSIMNDPTLKGWITGKDEGHHPAAADMTYEGEQNTNQAGFDTSAVNNSANGPAIPAAAGSEAFDEPISGGTAAAIAGLFIM